MPSWWRSRPRRPPSPAKTCRTSSFVERCFAYAPPRRPDAEFEAAAAALDRLLPGSGSLPERLERVGRAVRHRARSSARPSPIGSPSGSARALPRQFGLPDGEDLRISLVNGQPWSAYNWYDGGRRSRVDINTDLPNRAPELVNLIAHEAYPGHHLEHAWKEADLVDGAGRLESSILLINTPECLISEGLADLGRRFAVPAADHADLLVELFERAGLADRPRSCRGAGCRRTVHRRSRPTGTRSSAIRGNAAIHRHADGWTHDEVETYLRDVGRFSAPGGGQASRVHRASALADVCLRVRRGRGTPRDVAGGRPRSGAAWHGLAGCCTSS